MPTEKIIKMNVFGKKILAKPSPSGWKLFYMGDEGKLRPAEDIVVPSWIDEKSLATYLSDLCHEWASDRYPRVHVCDED
jgi:hypothetical protein